MLRAIIIDDEFNGVRSLELLIEKFVENVKVVASTTKPLEAIELINNYQPEIVFLDINMPVLNGFQLLEKVEFKKFHLIFCTAYKEYGLKALKQNALDYLLKPVGIEDLRQAVARVQVRIIENEIPEGVFELIKNLRSSAPQKISFPTRNTIEIISSDSVVYLEANSNNSIAVLASDLKLNVLRPLKDYESILCDQNNKFMRIHNSFIINLDYVLRYIREDGGSVEMSNKKHISVSKNKRDDLLKSLNNLISDL